MRFQGFIGLLTILAASGAGTVTAAAQISLPQTPLPQTPLPQTPLPHSPLPHTTLPMDLILPPERPSGPVSPASVAQGFNLSAAPLPAGLFHLPRPGAPAAVQPEPVRTEAKPAPVAASVAAPIPPPAPVRTLAPPPALTEPLQITPRPVATVARIPNTGPPAEPSSRTEPSSRAEPPSRTETPSRTEALSNKAIVERANAYFTNLTTLVADFTQIGGDGRRLGGTLYLQRPGKVRFDYDPPATLEVVADGSSVAVRDSKLATQDLYSVSQTPLKFLLREQVNLGQDIAITGIASDADSVRIALEDRSTLGGTARIMLYFDPSVQTLTQWRIVDAQGSQTMIVLNKAQRGRQIDQDLFKIRYEPILGGNNR
jgi:outer membrane lipoprotein-sorting protein